MTELSYAALVLTASCVAASGCSSPPAAPRASPNDGGIAAEAGGLYLPGEDAAAILAADEAYVQALTTLCGQTISMSFTSMTVVPTNPPPNINATVTDAAVAQAACATTLSQSIVPPRAYSCGLDRGIRYVLGFDGPAGPLFNATAGDSCGFISLNDAGVALVASAGFWNVIAGDIGVSPSALGE